ncbi:uncharacterized protein LOC119693389 [Plutella xylostella]|uniref:uncharacterized protein LOC119693389 n=1 Tax=Plutella xylostella TaxID=51655 RepID=UPI002033161E|nr:uncharacterized protein LOC119693389 [Plutella xylostella]
MSDIDSLLGSLEDTALLLRKAQINLKKCPKQRLTQGYLEARYAILGEYWSTFKSTHDKLVKVTPRDKRGAMPYFVNEDFYTTEDLYLCLQADIKDMLLQLREKNKDSDASTSKETCTDGQVKLPSIQLPTFSGKYEEWPTYHDLFTTLVHNNTSISQVQKLHYLKTSVSHEAEVLLRHIQVTESNYTQAWDILKNRYGNKRLIVSSLLKRLFNQRKISVQSAGSIKILLDTTTECINNLKNQKVSTDSWDPVIIFLIVQKLDSESHKEWEQYAYKEDPEALPSWSDMKKFLESKFRTLELVTPSSSAPATEKRTATVIRERTYHVSTTEKKCIMCKDNHTLCHCKEFTKMDPEARSTYVKDNRLCFNCLVPGHSSMKCKLPMSCRICNRRHHSLLHENRSNEPVSSSSKSTTLASQHVVEEKEEDEVQVNSMMASHINTKRGVALLATAIVEATNEQGLTIPLRALIDQGSEASFISENAAQLLKLKRQPMKGNVLGVGSTKTSINQLVQLRISSRLKTETCLSIQAYVIKKNITAKIPKKKIQIQQWPHLEGLELADPSYCMPGDIDLLLGVREYATILKSEFIKGPPGTPSAQRTSLGWILFGEVNENPQEDTFLVMHHKIDIDDMLKSIWEIETDNKRYLTRNEKRCEEIYETTTTRNEEGRYIVKLPFKNDSPLVSEANSKQIATQRFMQLERKFRRASDLKEEYTKVINDYIEQEHMERIPEKEKDIKKSVYLPHHAVVRDDKETSKTRVVFDAACKNSNNVSLNDELLVGPQLQEDLRNLLTRWRMKRICFMADIKQMYRQILVSKDDADYQRLIWRPNENNELEEYRLRRVTFGTSPAPYLAVRTLHQVANDEGKECKQATESIKTNFYMDDFLDGADSVNDAVKLAQEVTEILKKGGFLLTKWSSNDIEFMKSIDEDQRSVNAQVNLNLDGTVKALGIVWNLSQDTFQYNLRPSQPLSIITKRSILSDIQKLFDPLGWIAPSTVMAKLLIQNLWLEKIGWDDKVSDELEERWKQIRNDFTNVNEIQMKRWLGVTETNKKKIQMHGFSDSSMKAYGAVIYVRIETEDNEIETRLIAARTRVAPLKTISLPRLELCGALLLSKLMKQFGQAMRIPTTDMYAWTDSQIVIAWLSGEPNRWKPFVANRVVEIVENLNNNQWYHVQSKENPADLTSRGMLLSELKQCDLWWKGPKWLTETEIEMSKPEITKTELEKRKTKEVCTLTKEEDLESKKEKVYTNLNVTTEKSNIEEKPLTEQFEQFENLKQLIRSISLCRRFLNYKKVKDTELPFTTEELENTLRTCIKLSQTEEFGEEIDKLKMKKQVKNTSKLKSLNPYLDEHQILRVGGRLQHANISYESKHPIILGNKNCLTNLIVADAHLKTLHGGVQLTMSYLRSKYWIVRTKGLVKSHIHKCLTCAKHSAIAKKQIMGELPKVRVTPARAFIRSGVDFAGPFHVLFSKGRGAKTNKAYIAIFICMATKAIHLELVGDMTSQSFIGAFKRFVARRGICSDLWSDQGRNFVGANKELQEAWQEAKLEFTGEIEDSLASDGTQWHFIPAYIPNMGGLWEAGVKSIKHHLKRILTTNLTFEEMTTVLCEIEACLNSRPLCPIDEADTDNMDILTPGHFLIGEAPRAIPTPNLNNTKISTLSRWQHTQKLVQDFWKRWVQEYLTRLQQRPKWMNKQDEFKTGQIVLIKNDNLPPGKWALGRITDKHPGPDGYTRVYSVKSGDSVIKRSVTKLCYLPIDSDTN